MAKVAVFFTSYLLGSIPFGYLIVRFTAGADVRETGSGGTGATNVSRRAGKLAGVLTLLLDAAKGAAAVLVARLILSGANSNNGSWMVAAGVIAIVGHCFPVWLGFRGGKGVATGVGVFLVLAPLVVVSAAVIFLLLVVITRYVSLGSIAAAMTIPILLFVFGYGHPVFMGGVVSAALIIFMHRANIGRLLSGSESKFR